MTTGPTTVLCAGDLFIQPGQFETAIRSALGPGTVTTPYRTGWPDEPFGPVDGVREASGDPRRLAELVAPATALLTHLAPITAEVFAGAPELRVVGVTRGGPVNVDLDAATEHGVPVLFLPGRNLGAVAEFVVGVMIALTRNVGPASRGLAGGTWDARYYRYDRTGPELSACTVGLVGLGAVGARVATLLRAFGATVLAFDPFADTAAAGRVGAALVDLDELLARSDVVSLHARLTAETRGMFDERAFAAMKSGSYFVNTARGELVDQVALRQALERGALRGAALDVFSAEPPSPDDPLLSRPDVLLTPHLAGASRQVAEQSVDRICRAVADFLQTGAIEHCANPGWTAARGAGRS